MHRLKLQTAVPQVAKRPPSIEVTPFREHKRSGIMPSPSSFTAKVLFLQLDLMPALTSPSVSSGLPFRDDFKTFEPAGLVFKDQHSV